jgi:uncharacterized SAM-binding protein YcdF (DUF218 family)
MHDFLKNLILPPASLLIAALVAQFWWGTSRVGRRLVTASLVLLYLLSIPLVSDGLLSILEIFSALPADGPLPPGPQAIVILGADLRESPEYSTPSPGPLTLERLRYGARLQRRTGLPVLVTGGTPSGESRSIGLVMRQSLADDFQVPVVWVEASSKTTGENASHSTKILAAQGITRIYLVTHAWHMPRARLAFDREGLTVIPAPAAFTTSNSNRTLWEMMPSAKALQSSYFALHEGIGLAYYWLAFRP